MIEAKATPTPLPANSPRLRQRRVEAWVGGPKNERGAYPCTDEGRFTSAEDAQAWADAVYPDAYLVVVTSFAALYGWRPTPLNRRVEGTWER